MPGENGIALLGKIVEQYPDTAVIMVSGLDEIETAITTLKMGAHDYVTKPFDINAVESRVGRALEKRTLITCEPELPVEPGAPGGRANPGTQAGPGRDKPHLRWDGIPARPER